MKTDITTLVPAILVVSAAGYAVWVMYWFITENRRSRKGAGRTPSAPVPEKKKSKKDIVGKSLFVLPQRHSTPQATIETETVGRMENADNFAPASVPEHPKQIPPEELDEVFGEAPEGETNEPLDIDYDPLDDWSLEDEEDLPDYDDTGVLPIRGASLAQGVRFEQIGEAYRRVVHSPELTDEQKEETGKVLLNLKGTDMFNAFLSGKSEREDKVSSLIDAYLSAFHQKMADKSGESPSPQGDFPTDFSIRDFV